MKKAEATRKYILECAFDLVYENGYQATSLDRILDTTEVTKGAFYYHFKNKEEMGIALIREIIFPRIKAGLIDPLATYQDPLEGIYQTMKQFLLNTTEIQLANGCPTNNIIQEMAPINENFRRVLQEVLQCWEDAIVEALQKALEKNQISAKNNLQGSARFIIASYEGTRSTGKAYRSFAYYENYLRQLKIYLNSL